jgi:O-antigen ligase
VFKIGLQLVLSLVLLAGVGFAVVSQHGFEAILASIGEVGPSALAFAGGALLAAALLGAARVKQVAADFGYDLTWRDAFAALGLGQIGSALFFSVAGQLVARGTYLSARGQPVSATVLMVGYERVLAALVSFALAAAGAWYVLGQLGLDLEGGGAGFLKLLAGIVLAASAGAWLGWGADVSRRLRALGPARVAHRLGLHLALSFAIQLATMAAYVGVAHAVAPGIPLAKLVAASAVVMLAASLPVSFGGWGLRELSAVLVLGAVGMSAAAALVTAILVGLGSLLAVALLAAAALTRRRENWTPIRPSSPQIDHAAIVSTLLPLAAATFVFFNVHVPTETGGLNVNLADPCALLGGALFGLLAVRQRRWPAWRLARVNLYAGIATAALFTSLLIGAWRFGWTEWALINKFAGWFILLAYAATGAMIARDEEGLKLVLLTFAGAGMAVVAVELALLAVKTGGVRLPRAVLGKVFTGFAENRNAFAFQLLMVAAVSCVLRNRGIAVAGLALAGAGLIYAGSRAGWGAGLCMLAVALYMRTLSPREAAKAAFIAASVIALTWLPAAFRQLGPMPDAGGGRIGVRLIPEETSLAQRLESLEGGFDLFLQHPLFGAGLGAFVQEHAAETGIALVIHSTPVWLLAELGLIGLLAFAVPALLLFGAALKRSPNDSAAMLMVLILTVFGVMSLAHELLYQRSLWLLLGVCLACTKPEAAKRPAA